MATKYVCHTCGQPQSKRRDLALPRKADRRKPTLPGDYHCPRCGKLDVMRLRRDVRALTDAGLPCDTIARRLGLTNAKLIRLIV